MPDDKPTHEPYRLRARTQMARLYDRMPTNVWLTARDVYSLLPGVTGPSMVVTALVSRGLVEREVLRTGTNSYRYRKVAADHAVEQTTRHWTPPAGGDIAPPAPLTPHVKPGHGTVRKYMDDCRCKDCTRAYREASRALGLEG